MRCERQQHIPTMSILVRVIFSSHNNGKVRVDECLATIRREVHQAVRITVVQIVPEHTT